MIGWFAFTRMSETSMQYFSIKNPNWALFYTHFSQKEKDPTFLRATFAVLYFAIRSAQYLNHKSYLSCLHWESFKYWLILSWKNRMTCFPIVDIIAFRGDYKHQDRKGIPLCQEIRKFENSKTKWCIQDEGILPISIFGVYDTKTYGFPRLQQISLICKHLWDAYLEIIFETDPLTFLWSFVMKQDGRFKLLRRNAIYPDVNILTWIENKSMMQGKPRLGSITSHPPI